MGIFKNSKHIFKSSYKVVKKDKELLLFPVLAAIFSIAYFFAMLFPTVFSELLTSNNEFAMNTMRYVMIVLTYFGLAFIMTFFDFCAVYTIKKRFEGGNSKFFEAIKYAFSKIHLIFAWSIISATVGLILNVIEQIARNSGNFGRILLTIVRFGLSVAWSIMSMFVIPAMVYYELPPTKAMKKSSRTFSKTWGENLVRQFGMFLFLIIFGLLGVGLVVGIYYLTIPVLAMGTRGLIITIVVGVIYFVLLALFYSALNKVYNTALFVYADSGNIPGEYDSKVVKSAFKVQSH